MKKRIITAAALALLIVLLSGCEKAQELVVYETEEATENLTVETENQTAGFLYVYVCGEVNAPGVYKLENGQRVYEAILMAGGLTGEAAETYVNQAEALKDGQKIYVPSKAEAETGLAEGGTGGLAEEADGKVNLNTASKEELMTLSGIGEAKAEDIIAYREEHGGFQTIEEVKEISGIKDAVFNKIKDMIKVQ